MLAGNHGSSSHFSLRSTSDVSRFAYKSIRLHRGRFAYTAKSFRLHGLSRFAYIEVVSPTLITLYKLKYFVKMDEHHCLQLAEESYMTVFPVKFRDITAFDRGGERLLVRV